MGNRRRYLYLVHSRVMVFAYRCWDLKLTASCYWLASHLQLILGNDILVSENQVAVDKLKDHIDIIVPHTFWFIGHNNWVYTEPRGGIETE